MSPSQKLTVSSHRSQRRPFLMTSHLSACTAYRFLIVLALVVVFAIPFASAQTLTVLYSFSGGTDGGQPYSQLTPDPAGNGYGTTAVGGDMNACPGVGCGVIFEIDRTGVYHVLYTFAGGTDGANPWSGLLRDAAGNLYGTSEAGGSAGFG